MPHILWLVYEAPPHPDAVSYPAIADDVRLIAELFALPSMERVLLAEKLRDRLRKPEPHAGGWRQLISFRSPAGSNRAIPSRFAKWLRFVLPMHDTVDRLRALAGHWLASEDRIHFKHDDEHFAQPSPSLVKGETNDAIATRTCR